MKTNYKVMENGPPTTGFDEGTIDVERLLVEPQDGHASVDSVMCYNEKIPEKGKGTDDISHNFGITNPGPARERENVLSHEALDSVSYKADVGYFRLQNDFCSMGEAYLLGVGLSESVTNLDYGPSEGLLSLVSDSSILASNASPWKADLFRIMELPDCPDDRLNPDTSDFCEFPSLCNESETPTDEKTPMLPESSNSQDSDMSQIVSIDSEQMAPLFPSIETLHSLKNNKDDNFLPNGQNVETRADCTGGPTTPKRSRRPTQRYIDELSDPIPRISKRKREVSYSNGKNKSLRVKDYKKCRVASKAPALADEDSSVVAIQVPFGSLVHKESPKSPACDMNKEIETWHKQVRSSDRGSPTLKSKDYRAMPENRKRRDEHITSVNPMKMDHSSMAGSKKPDHIVASKTRVKKGDECLKPPNHKNNNFVQASSRKKDNKCMKTTYELPSYDCPTEDSSEEVTGRRKHHRLWTIAEVKKLINGVSEYGVGRWSRIKKLYFSTSAHRTSVDLKDKWRNLLKASQLQLGNQQDLLLSSSKLRLNLLSFQLKKTMGEKKRNMAWRPLPKSILHRVCELANTHPYPKGGAKRKITSILRDSTDGSTVTALNHYRRILRSINGN